jgi:predicted extracellular nuclease
MSSTYYVAFWNVENLFDVENSPRRSDKLKRVIGKSLKGWSDDKLDAKISQLASIIRRMNAGKGPDLLGVCEVENEHVVNLLVQAISGGQRNYRVVHEDTQDQRGIDVAFIYDPASFTFEKKFSHFVMRRTCTRDLLQVNFKTSKGRDFVVIGNHWPSRSGGRYESASYRATAGETLAYFHHRILQELGKDVPVLAMGDFNDEPFDTSLTDFALAIRSRTQVSNARTVAKFFNLTWQLLERGGGTFFFNNSPNFLDQFLANKNLLGDDRAIRAEIDSAEVILFPEMVKKGLYRTPIAFGGMGKPVNLQGFSDHFPIGIRMKERG